ncbi:hypothetical protein [Blastomonas sp.]|uniref:hypothetical protein n=1 Tax=Blastomonas sp. TaxID=1909299 RepID=UPI00391943A8
MIGGVAAAMRDSLSSHKPQASDEGGLSMKILKITLLIILALLLVVPAFMLSRIMNEPCISIGWDNSLKEFKYILSGPDRCSAIPGAVKKSGSLFLTDEGLGIKFYGSSRSDDYEIHPPIQLFIRDNRELFFKSNDIGKHTIEFEGVMLRPDEWRKKETFYIDRMKIIEPK